MRRLINVMLIATLALIVIPKGHAEGDIHSVYKSKCQSCHGAKGDGNTHAGKSMKVRDFHSPEVVNESDDTLFEVTKNGRKKMPAYGKKLTDDQIKTLVQYIRQLK